MQKVPQKNAERDNAPESNTNAVYSVGTAGRRGRYRWAVWRSEDETYSSDRGHLAYVDPFASGVVASKAEGEAAALAVAPGARKIRALAATTHAFYAADRRRCFADARLLAAKIETWSYLLLDVVRPNSGLPIDTEADMRGLLHMVLPDARHIGGQDAVGIVRRALAIVRGESVDDEVELDDFAFVDQLVASALSGKSVRL
jgi:hypothetical protein